MSMGSVRPASGRIPHDAAFSDLLPPPETTAYLLRKLAARTSRQLRGEVPECEWVGPACVWRAARGELALAGDDAGDADDHGFIASLPETAVVAKSAIEPWLAWWLAELTRRARRIRDPRCTVEQADADHLQLEQRIADAVAFLREHWASAAVELHLLVRKVLFVHGLDSGSASNERVFGAVALAVGKSDSTCYLAGDLVAATARLSLHLRSQESPPLANGNRLRVFPGPTLRDLSEGFTLAVAAARRVTLARRAAHRGAVDPAHLEAELAELDGIVDVLRQSAEWANWGHGLYQTLDRTRHETRSELRPMVGRKS